MTSRLREIRWQGVVLLSEYMSSHTRSFSRRWLFDVGEIEVRQHINGDFRVVSGVVYKFMVF